MNPERKELQPHMLVGIHQLHYLPWLRYFEKIARADVFVVLDDVQFAKNDWQNRNRVKTASGAVTLTVPVQHRLGQRLDEVRLAPGSGWARKHWQTVRQAYGRAPYFSRFAPFLETTYATAWESLNALNRHLLEGFAGALEIRTPLVYASTLGVSGAASARLAALVRAVGGDSYYCGAYAAATYLDRKIFDDAGIEVVLQVWDAPVYPQLHGAFIPDLSVLDLLMNCGPASCNILRGATA